MIFICIIIILGMGIDDLLGDYYRVTLLFYLFHLLFINFLVFLKYLILALILGLLKMKNIVIGETSVENIL